MIETLETVEIGDQPTKLRDCPFCGAKPYWLGVVRGPNVEPHFYHPGVATDTDCILSGQGLLLEDAEAWNTRPDTAPDDVVEAVAKALYEHSSPPSAGFKPWPKLRPEQQENYRRKAGAAIAAMPKSDGLRRSDEATQSMICAGGSAVERTKHLTGCQRAVIIYKAMRDAALTQGGEVG